MKMMVMKMKAGARPATEHLEDPLLVELAEKLFREASVNEVFAVLNRIRDEETEVYIRSLLQKAGVETIGIFPEDTDLTRTWLKGDVIISNLLTDSARQVVSALELAETQSTPSAQRI
jgi:CO dehydrogenase nickel-insertion accessory protein CooC1